MEHGYHLYPDGTRIPVPGCSDGLVQPVRAELVAVVDDGGGFLPRSAAACFAAGSAGYLQQRSRGAVHQRPVYRRTGNAPHRDQHGRAGRCLDNIFVERLWRSLKYEEVYLKDYTTVTEARAGIECYFRFYNQERLHQSLGYRTPAAIYQARAY